MKGIGVTEYEQWLETQDEEFIDETLGSDVSRKFIDGEITVEKFSVIEETELTMKQLNQKGNNYV